MNSAPVLALARKTSRLKFLLLAFYKTGTIICAHSESLHEMTQEMIQRLLLLGGIAGVLAAQNAPPNTYLVHNLVSDLPGLADHQDPNLQNPWGNGFGTTPFWIGNSGTGTVTIYDGTGQATGGLMPIGIPQAGGAGNAGPVTGVVDNLFFSTNPSAFQVSSAATGISGASMFMFCSENGVISGWNLSVVLPKNDETQLQSDALILFRQLENGRCI